MRTQWADDERFYSLDVIRGYVENELMRDATDAELMAYIERHGYVPATCSVCERELPEDARYPLCRTCEGSARAHARHERHRIEWMHDVDSDPGLGRRA
jgi:hypothetical protein